MQPIEQLSNLDELVLRCRTEQSKEYIKEAVGCYRVGAFRACIVNTWIALVFDLIDKIRILHFSGNAKATLLFEKFKTYQEQIEKGSDQGLIGSSNFERNILKTVSQELGFFSSQELEDLDRLRKDRHRCAHPSQQSLDLPYKPSAELARLHLRNTIVSVLAQQPVQGKAALDELLGLITSKTFPKSLNGQINAQKQLEASAIYNGSDSLINNFIDMVLYGYIDENSPLYRNIRARLALVALSNIHYEKTISRVAEQSNKIIKKLPDTEFIYGILHVIVVRDVWGILDQGFKERIKQYFRTKDVYVEFPQFLKRAYFIADLALIIDEYIEGLNDKNILTKIVSKGFKSRTLVEKTKQIYLDSNNLKDTIKIIQVLLSPIVESFNKNDIENIIQSTDKELLGLAESGEFIDFLSTIVDEDILAQDELEKLLSDNDLSTVFNAPSI